ncbi:MAG TPA: hypothetical protein VI749_09520 [Candidatus Omnitrophota bacterium]|nr:hypothetical protein [Candidatus Omnitrophota bacterium]
MIQKFVSGLSEKERKVFYITVLFVSLALFDRLFIGPVLSHLERLDLEIEKQKVDILRDRRFLAYQDRIKKESEIFSKYFSAAVPDDDVVNAQFLSLIEKLATLGKVSLIKSNPSHTNKQELFNEYFASVDCNGNLEDVISFMHTINTTEELLKVTKFNMSPRRGGSENEVKVSMSVVKLISH